MILKALKFSIINIGLTSATCGQNTTYSLGETLEYNLAYKDVNFGDTTRYYYVDMPENYDPS